MGLSFPSLQYFKKAAELQHLTNAAKSLHIAQPSLSRAITSIEEELGVKLFERQGRNVFLTAYGKIVLEYAQIILSDLDEMKSAINTARNPENCTVILSYYAASRIINSFLKGFFRNYPEIKIKLLPPHANTLMNQAALAKENSADLILSTSLVPIRNKHTTTLFKEPLVLALRTDDPLTRYPFVELNQLATKPFIFFPEGFAIKKMILTYFKSKNIVPKIVAYSDNPATVAEYIKSNLGIAIIPKFAWHDLATKEIAFIPISESGLYRYITLTNISKSTPPAKLLFVNWNNISLQTFLNL